VLHTAHEEKEGEWESERAEWDQMRAQLEQALQLIKLELRNASVSLIKISTHFSWHSLFFDINDSLPFDLT
jgi:hypothetical protein